MAARTDATRRLRALATLSATLLAVALLSVASLEASEAPRATDEKAVDDYVLQTDRSGWQIEEFRTRLTVFSQASRSGYQSQAGSVDGPGSEDALIIQPSGLITLRQSPDVVHQVIVPVDIVSASSPNSIDALSTASAVNETGRIEWRTHANLSPTLRLNATGVAHFEEPYRAGQLGVGLEQSLADDNATIGLNIDAALDQFNNNLPDGAKVGEKYRGALAASVAASQLLSPTTVFLANYGFTIQRGTLHTTWNSVPLEGGLQTTATRGGERFPDQRLRHALTLELAQHVPLTRSTLRGSYRYYSDDFGVRAHTAQATYYQYLGAHWLARSHYRFHRQTAVDFYGTSFPQTVPAAAFLPGASTEARWLPAIDETADSDLAAFDAHEAGAKLSILSDRGTSVDVSYIYYVRTNGLAAQIFAIAYGAEY